MKLTKFEMILCLIAVVSLAIICLPIIFIKSLMKLF